LGIAAAACSVAGQAERGAVVVVRRDGDVRGLGHGGDLAQLEDAAAIAHVRVQDVGGAAGDHLVELDLRVQLLAGDDGQGDVALGLDQSAEVARGHGLLEPEGPTGLHPPGDADRVLRAEPAVHLHEDLHVRAHRVAHGADARDGEVLVLPIDVRAPGAGEGVELERGEAAGDHGARRLRHESGSRSPAQPLA
jgi:hypothetical protein